MLFPRPSYLRRPSWLVLLCWLSVLFPAFADNQAPVLSGSLPAVTVLENAAESTIDLTKSFSDPDVPGTVVRLAMVYNSSASVTTGTNIDIALFDKDTPITVANFLSYVNSQLYDNTFIHRAPAGFVIQGGGFTFTGTDSLTLANLKAIPKSLPILNEYSPTRSNLRGTIAMAKLGGDPNSATNEWFLNLGDNSANLDTQNGGFTVFGRVLGDGMSVADDIDSITKFDYSGNIGFADWPLGDGRAAGASFSTPITQDQLVRVESATVIPALTFSAESDDTSVVQATVDQGVLSLSYISTGTANITVTATDLDGATVSQSFPVDVQPSTTDLVAFESDTVTANEGGAATLNVVHTGTNVADFTVHYAMIDLTGTAGIDYTAAENDLHFTLSGTAQTISIPLPDNGIYQTGKSFRVVLSSPSDPGVLLGTNTVCTVNITDNTPNPSGALEFSSSSYGVTAGTPLSVEVIRTGGSAGQVTAVVSTSDGDAVNGTNYQGVTQLVTFADGDTTPKRIVIPTLLTDGTSGFQHFTLSLVAPTGGATLGATSSADVSISQNIQSEGTFAFAFPEFRAAGSGTDALITVERLGGSGTTASVAFSTGTGTATAGTHFVATSGTLTFGVGERWKTFAVTLLPGADSVNRTVALHLTEVSATTPVDDSGKDATLVIAQDNPNGVIEFQSTTFPLNSGTSGAITLVRSGSTGSATAYLALDDQTAVLGIDYTTAGIVGRFLTVHFADGSSTATVTINSALVTGKIFKLRLLSTSPGSAVGEKRVATVDISARTEFSRATYRVSEASGKLLVAVVRTGTGASSVDYATTGVSAADGTDFTGKSGTLSFAAGELFKTIEIPILTPATPAERTFNFTLSNPVNTVLGENAVATVSIVPTASGGSFAFEASEYRFDADGTYKTVTVVRTGTAPTVYVQLADASGNLQTDGTSVDAGRVLQLDFEAGQTSATFNIGEALGKGDSTVQLALVDSSADGTIGSPAIATVSFVDPSRADGLIEFSPADYRVSKSIGTARITVIRTGAIGEAKVQYATANGTAIAGTNYVAKSGTLTFPAGVLLATIDVPIIATAVTEGSFVVNLSNPTPNGGPVLGEFSQATVTIVKNSNATAGIFRFAQTNYSFDADGNYHNVSVVRSATGQATTVLVRALDGTARLATTASSGINQYTLDGVSNGTVAVSFAANELSKTVSIGALQVDGFRKLNLALIASEGAAVGTPYLTEVDFYNGNLAFTPTAYRVKQANGKAVLVITRKNGLGTAKVVWKTVAMSGTTAAVANTDYTPVASGTASFAAGESFTTITVPLKLNPALTTDRTFQVQLVSVPGGESGIASSTKTATVTLFKGTADDAVWFQQSSYRFDSSLLRVSSTSLQGSYRNITLVRKVAGKATTAKVMLLDRSGAFGVDYITYQPSTGIRTVDVQFAQNSFTADLPIGGFIGKGNKSMAAILVNASSGNSVGTPSRADVSFFDANTGAGAIEFSPAIYRVSGTSATITAVRSGTTGAVSVGWKAVDSSTAKYGVNYSTTSGTSGTLSFAAGETTQTIPVRLMGSGTNDQSFAIILTGTATGGASIGASNSAQVTIVNRRTAGNFSFSSSSYAFATGVQQGLTIARSGTGQVASVTIRLRGGSGRIGADCGFISNSNITSDQTTTVSFAANQTSAAVAVGAFSGNGDKTMTIELADSSANSTIGSPRTADITFVDQGVVNFTGTACHVSGTSEKAYLAVMRTGTTSATSVVYTAIDGTAVSGTDYALKSGTNIVTSGTLSFAAGEVFKTIEVPLLVTSATNDQSFKVQLSSASAAIGANDTVTITKVAEPTDGGIAFSTDRFRFNSGKYESVTLVRSGTGQKATAYVHLIDGSGVFGVDCLSSSSVTNRIVAVDFAANQSTASFTLGAYSGKGQKAMTLELVDTSAGTAAGSPNKASITFLDAESTKDLLAFSLSTHQVSGTNGMALVSVVRSGTNTGAVTVKYTTLDETAVSGTDYTVTSGTLSFAAGVKHQTIQVPILLREIATDRTFAIQLSDPTGEAIVGLTDRTEVTITGTAPAGIISFGSANFSINSEEDGVVELVRSGTGGQTASVYIEAIDGTAKLSTKATLVGGTNVFLVSGTTERAGVITFAANETSKPLLVSGIASSGNKEFKLRLVDTLPGATIGLPSETTITVLDTSNPHGVIEFSPAEYRVNPAFSPALISVTRSGTAGAVDVGYTTNDGTAVSGTDYTLTSGTLSFAAGEVSKLIEVPLLTTSATGERTFTVGLTGTATGGAEIGANDTATVVIASGSAGAFQFAAGNYRINDTLGGQVTIMRTGTGQAATVWVQAFDGNADPAAGEFSMTGATGSRIAVQFGAAATSATISIKGQVAATKDFTLKLIGASAGYGVGAIGQTTVTMIDQASGLLEFSPATYHVNVSGTAGKAYVSVVRSVAISSSASVVYTAVDGTAHAGTDFVASSGTLTFAAGETIKTFGVALLPTTATVDRTFTITLSNATGAEIGATNIATVTLVKKTPAGLFRFSPSSYTLDAVAGGLVTIVRSGTGQSAHAYVQLVDGTAKLDSGEYWVNGSSSRLVDVSFAANELSKTLTVRGNVSASKNLTLRLVDASVGAGVGTPSSASVTLFNGTVGFAPATYHVSGTTTALITVTRTGVSGALNVIYNTANGTAIAGTDYTAKSGTLTFNPGESFKTFEVPVKSGTIDRVFSVKLALGSLNAGAKLGAASSAVVTVVGNAPGGKFKFGATSYNMDDSTGGKVVVTRDRTGTAATATVEALDGSASLDSREYTVNGGISRMITLSFAATEASKTINVTGAVSGPKYFTLRLVDASAGSAVGSPNSTRVNLLDLDAAAGLLEFSPTTYFVTGTSALVKVVRSGTEGTASVNLTVGSSAPTALSFAAGETVKGFEVQTGTTAATFSLALSNASGASLGANSRATVTRVTSAANGIYSFGSSAYSLDESGGTVTIRRDKIGTAATVYVQAVDGSASLTTGTLGANQYSVRNGSTSGSWMPVTFEPNDLFKTLSVAGNVDAPRNFSLRLVASQAGTAVGTPGKTTVTLNPINVVEFSPTACRVSGSTASITVVRSGTAGAITADYSATDGTAVSGTDYKLMNGASVVTGTGTLSIPNGSRYGTVQLQLTGTATEERSFTLNLTGSTTGGAIVGTGSSATVTIVPSAPSGVFSFATTGTGSSATTNVSMLDTAPGVVTVLRTGTGQPATVYVEALDGSASLARSGTPGINEYAISGFSDRIFELTFTPGQTSQTLSLLSKVDGTRNFKLRLVNASLGAAVGAKSDAVVTVNPNGMVQFSPTEYRVSGSNAILTVIRSGTSGAASLTFTTKNGTAVAGTDYVATSGTLVFPAGKMFATGTIPLKSIATTAEKSFAVSLSNSNATGGAFAGADNTAAVTIVRSAPAGVFSFSSTQYRVEDGGDGTITVLRTGTGQAAFAYVEALDGSARLSEGTLSDNEYLLDGGSDRTTFVYFAANQRSATLSVSGVVTGTRNFTLRLVNGSPGSAVGAPNEANVTLIDSSSAKGLVAFGQTTCHVSGSAGKAVLTVVRSGTSSPTSVAYSVDGGSGSTAVTSGTVSFADGDTQKTIELPLLATTSTTNRTFTVSLAGTPTNGVVIGANNQAVVTIMPKASAGFFSFAQSSYRVDAGNLLAITINRSVATKAASASVALIDDSGRVGVAGGWVDSNNKISTARLLTVPFPAGQFSNTFYVAGATDLGDTNISLKLVDVSDGSAIGAPSAATVSFFDVNLPYGVLEFYQSDYRISESGTFQRVTVVRSNTWGPVTVGYRTSNGTAVAGTDYVAASGTLTFAPGVNSATFDVRLIDNTQSATEAKNIKLTLENPGGYARIGAQNTANIWVFDNDNPNGVFEIEQHPYNYNLTAGWGMIDIIRSAGTKGAVNLLLDSHSKSTALIGTDVRFPNRNRSQISVHFEPGQTRQTVAIPLTGTSGQVASDNPRVFIPVIYTTGTGITGLNSFAYMSLYSAVGLTQPAVEFEDARYRFDEPATSAIVQVIVKPYGPAITGTATVPFSLVQDGEAKAGIDYDYADANRTVKLSGTNAVSIPVKIMRGATAGSEKRFTVKLGTPSTGVALLGQTTAEVTIIDRQARDGVFEFDADSYAVDEDSGQAFLTLVRSGSAATTASVLVGAVNGTALEAIASGTTQKIATDSDYFDNVVAVNFAAGEREKRVGFTLIHNEKSLLDHYFLGQILWSGTGGGTGVQKFSTVLSANVDGFKKPALGFAASVYEVDENQGTVVVQVRRTGNLSDTVKIGYSAVPDTAVAGTDYTVAPGTLTFGPNEVLKNVTISVKYNPLSQPDRKFFLQLGTPQNVTHPQTTGATANSTGAALLENSKALIGILDVNRAPGGVITFGQAQYSVTETQGKVAVTVVRSGKTDLSVQTFIAVKGGTATAGTDYPGKLGELSVLQFAPGQASQTVEFVISKRAGTQGPRTVEIGLYEPASATVANGSRVGTRNQTTVTISD